jgi:hypothetical protein
VAEDEVGVGRAGLPLRVPELRPLHRIAGLNLFEK